MWLSRNRSSHVSFLHVAQVLSTNAYFLIYREEGFEEAAVVSDFTQLPGSLVQQARSLRDDFAQRCEKFPEDFRNATEALQERKAVSVMRLRTMLQR